MVMIYTIGHRETYLQAIAERGVIVKTGKMDGYPGGYAFETIADAQRRIDEEYPTKGFVVFGLKADWEDTEPDQSGGWWHHLVKDAEIVELDDQEGECMLGGCEIVSESPGFIEVTPGRVEE